MFKVNYKIASLTLVLVLMAETAVFADGNTQTIGISCVIPAIPGVNAMLDEKQALQESKSALAEKNVQPKEENQQEQSTLITEDTQGLRLTGQEKAPQLVWVKTFYSR